MSGTTIRARSRSRRRRVLEAAKGELRALYGRKDGGTRGTASKRSARG